MAWTDFLHLKLKRCNPNDLSEDAPTHKKYTIEPIVLPSKTLFRLWYTSMYIIKNIMATDELVDVGNGKWSIIL